MGKFGKTAVTDWAYSCLTGHRGGVHEMEGLGKLIAFVVLALLVPTGVVWIGWKACGIFPEEAWTAIVTAIAVLAPYGISAVVWLILFRIGIGIWDLID